MKLIRDLLVDFKDKKIRVGFIFNNGEINSTKQLEMAIKAAKNQNITIVPRTADNSTKVKGAATSLIGGVDAIYVPLDNVAASAITSIIQVGKKSNIPVFASDPEGVEQGALATIGPTHYDEGLTAGQIVIDILNGKQPSDIPVKTSDNNKIYFNKSKAKELNIELPCFIKNNSIEVKYID